MSPKMQASFGSAATTSTKEQSEMRRVQIRAATLGQGIRRSRRRDLVFSGIGPSPGEVIREPPAVFDLSGEALPREGVAAKPARTDRLRPKAAGLAWRRHR